MSSELTSGIDVAQVVLYVFWIFFAGLIYWLRREDRREGYPLETDNPRRVHPLHQFLIPKPKTFILPDGGTVQAPNFHRDGREINATRTANSAGSPLEPTGDPLLSGVGAASFANRVDRPELTREGHDLIVPMRTAGDFRVSAGPDPRGWNVVAGDGKSAGSVKELWVDRADVMVRYLEVALAPNGATTGATGGAAAGEAANETRLVPITMVRIQGERKQVEVVSVLAAQFASVPPLKGADRITVLEEEKICAFYAGGRRYAEPKRLGPVV